MATSNTAHKEPVHFPASGADTGNRAGRHSDDHIGTRPATLRSRKRRRGWSRAHAGLALIALLAFLLNWVAVRSFVQTRRVLSLSVGISQGQPIPESAISFVEIGADAETSAAFYGTDDIDKTSGMVASHDLAPGDLLGPSDLVSKDASGPEMRTMAIPFEGSSTVALLAPGDLIDVMAVSGDRAWYVATGIEVVSSGSDSSGGLVGSTEAAVIVSVDPSEALALAYALSGSKVHVARSTGATSAAGTPDMYGGIPSPSPSPAPTTTTTPKGNDTAAPANPSGADRGGDR